MDTISSRESNTNFLPMAGVIVGAIALIFAIVALVKVASANRDINELKGINDRVASLENQVGQLGSLPQAVADMKNYAGSIAKGTNDGFSKVSDELTAIKARLDKIESSRVANVRSGPRGATAAVAGPGEYLVKQGDTGATIARANGVRLADLMAVNPNVDWRRMHIGQRIKLPARAGAQSGQPAQSAAAAQAQPAQ
jgi:LysM repeat protein